MADLLLHSLAELREILFPCLEATEARTVVEVGSEHGTMTQRLLDHVEALDGELTVIDPAPAPEAEALLARHPRARLDRRPSLEALPELSADAYLIDGDHNHYTVLRESNLIWENARAAGKPFLVFYHDVGWPWGRRDLYYDPERIPAEHRQPYDWDRGVVPGRSELVEGGFRGMGHWAPAANEGGPGNGVLTAIEDFVEGKEQHLVWACVPAVFGLGVLFANDAPWTDLLRGYLLPYHMNPLLERLERNRLECYLRVLEWQDRARAPQPDDAAA